MEPLESNDHRIVDLDSSGAGGRPGGGELEWVRLEPDRREGEFEPGRDSKLGSGSAPGGTWAPGPSASESGPGAEDGDFIAKRSVPSGRQRL